VWVLVPQNIWHPSKGISNAIDQRVDIYALGIVFYEMVVGRKPYQADTPMAVILKKITTPLPRPKEYISDLPEKVEHVLFKALSRRPEDRYLTMIDFITALERLLYQHDTVIPTRSRTSLNRIWAIGLGTVLLLFLGGLYLLNFGKSLRALPASTTDKTIDTMDIPKTPLLPTIPSPVLTPTMNSTSTLVVSSTPSRIPTPTQILTIGPRIILERLKVAYLGQDGYAVIGSGCPGNDSRGELIDYHLKVNGVSTSKVVKRVLVVGDNSTLTWEWPCSNDWGLVANDGGGGNWDIFIAPSSSTRAYVIAFFYDDNSMALGMAQASSTTLLPKKNEQLSSTFSASAVGPKVILTRLTVSYLGQDGHTVVGSGCPGNDGIGKIIDYHFVVSGVSTSTTVKRVLVVGDNSTLTWEWPCSNDWGLVANDIGAGKWDVYIAPSLATQMYTVIFFYENDTMALGITQTR